jgi:hypothetical protein
MRLSLINIQTQQEVPNSMVYLTVQSAIPYLEILSNNGTEVRIRLWGEYGMYDIYQSFLMHGATHWINYGTYPRRKTGTTAFDNVFTITKNPTILTHKVAVFNGGSFVGGTEIII